MQKESLTRDKSFLFKNLPNKTDREVIITDSTTPKRNLKQILSQPMLNSPVPKSTFNGNKTSSSSMRRS